MKYFHTTTYCLQNNRIRKDFKILVFSDLHFSYKISDLKLDMIINEAKRIKPTYIFIVGDLIDSVDMITNREERNRLLLFLKQLSSLSTVLISLGNHDCYKKNSVQQKFTKNKWIYCYDEEFIKSMNVFPNVHVLKNSVYEDDNIFVLGVFNSFSYYHAKGKLVESKEQMIHDLECINPLYLKHLPHSKVKFVMVHSPVYMQDDSILDTLKEYDYICSGHMHNGCVPPILNELWRSSRGIISPTRELFLKNERNTLCSLEDKLVVNGPLTTLQECAGFMEKFDILFPMYDSVFEFKKGENYLHIKRKYHK